MSVPAILRTRFAYAFVAAAGLLAAQAAPAWATPDLTPAFTGTVVFTYPDGRKAKLWLNSDGSYRGLSRRGVFSSGRWTVKGPRICMRQSRPVPIPFSHCSRLPADGVTSWTDKAVTGEQIRLDLVAGR